MRASTIRAVRQALKLTQDEFARALMVKECTVYRWEADKRRSLSIDILRRVVLETLAAKLFDGTKSHGAPGESKWKTAGEVAAHAYHNHAFDAFQPTLIMTVLGDAWRLDCKRRGIQVRAIE